MDAARAADQSWPTENPQFRRPWQPPPLKRRSPAPGGTGNGAGFVSSSNPKDNGPDASAQRAAAAALRHADRLHRKAAALAAVGQRDAALRVAALAARLREAGQ